MSPHESRLAAQKTIAARLGSSPPHPNFASIDPRLFEGRLLELLNRPEALRQQFLDACGFAALAYALLRHQPHRFIDYALDLYLTGRSQLGSQEVVFSHGVQAVKRAQQNAPGNLIVDWLLLLPLVNAFVSKSYLAVDYDTATLTRILAAVWPSALPNILRAAGFRIDRRLPLNGTNLPKPRAEGAKRSDRIAATLVEATRGLRTVDRAGFGLVNAEYLAWQARQQAAAAAGSKPRAPGLLTGLGIGIPNHWIVIHQPVQPVPQQDGSVLYEVPYVTWGQAKRLTLPAARVDTLFFGITLARL